MAQRAIPDLQGEEQGLEDAHDGQEEEHDDVVAQEEEGQHQDEAHLLVDPGGVVGEIVQQDLASVQEGQRDEVEDAEQDVDQDAEVEEQDQGKDAGEALDAEGGVAHGEVGGDDEGVQSAGEGMPDDDQDQQCDDCGEQLRGGTGQGSQHLVSRGIPEVARGEGDRLAPAQDQRAAKDEEYGPDERAEQIKVASRVHAEAAHHAGGRVAQPIGGPGLSAVMQGDGEHHDDQLEDDQSVVQRHRS